VNIVLILMIIGMGGAMGALCRFAITQYVCQAHGNSFPWGTLVVNVLGCLLMGLLIGSRLVEQNSRLYFGFAVGFLGSMTTFSAFSAETICQLQSGMFLAGMANVILNVTICLIAVSLGIAIAGRFCG
jgi:CrcB protein